MDITTLPFDEAAVAWDRSGAADRLATATAQRDAFLELFPPDVWSDLPLEDYALGQNDRPDVFSRWIEFGTAACGSIAGGSSMKHLIFLRKEAQTWWFVDRYETAEEAWNAIRSGFETLVEHGRAGRWEEIDQLDALWGGKAVKGKTAWMYFPESLLPIYSGSHLDYWLSIFDLDAGDAGVIGKNRRLFEFLVTRPELAGFSSLEIMLFLYDWAHPERGRSVFRVSPGENARLWSDCRDGGAIRVGWNQLGDLAEIDTFEELLPLYHAAQPAETEAQAKHGARALLMFRNLKPGDIVIANRGTTTVLGIGRVVDEYHHDPSLSEYRHVVDVDWFDTDPRTVDVGGGWRSTISKIRPDQYQSILTSVAAEPGAAEMTDTPTRIDVLPEVPTLHLEAERLLKRSGQLVFYGPPGTGKTYSARRHAAWLLAGGSHTPNAARAFGPTIDLEAIEASYEAPESRSARPGWLFVANRKEWSWDELGDGTVDFRRGRLKRNYAAAQPGDRVYGYEASPTKAVVARASVIDEVEPGADGQILLGEGESVAGPTYDELVADPILQNSEPVQFNMQGTMFRLEPDEADHLDGLIGSPESAPSNSGPRLAQVTFHPSYAYEDFIEGYKPTPGVSDGLVLEMRDGIFKRMCRTAAADPGNPYVILIDEINRGNIPKIFGELITLIEKDKRGMSVSLPQSGDSLVVPDNLYLIGTMNTADRSIHVMDAALRRRFAFLELMPDAETLADTVIGNLPLDQLLTELNRRVRDKAGRERQLGHAMFMNGPNPVQTAEDFALAIRYEVLPMLQEYVYGDYADLADLLGPGVIDAEEQTPRYDVLEDPERLVSAIAKHLNISLG
jgi:5-methylcytosine-specific restriction protein B